MMEDAYNAGVLRALQDAELVKTGASIGTRLGLGALGAVLGSGTGLTTGKAYMDMPKGPIWGLWAPTQGQVDLAKIRAGGTGALVGFFAGFGLGALSPNIWNLVKRIGAKDRSMAEKLFGPERSVLERLREAKI